MTVNGASAQPAAEPRRLLPDGADLAFRGYRLRPEDRLLLRDGTPVEIGGRAFDLLLVLLRSRGQVVSKAEIFDYVWPSTLVDESNLRFQMACLRRVLGKDGDVIKTVKGRGYILTAEGSRELLPSKSEGVEGHAGPAPTLAASPSRGPAVEASRHERIAPMVAIVDDDEGTREALDGLLRSAGFTVDAFASVGEFAESGRKHQAHCLILDVWMPGRSGLEFHEDLVREGLQLPVIFISGHADVQMSVRAMKAGAAEFLTKPVRHQDLLDAIRHAVGQNEQLH